MVIACLGRTRKPVHRNGNERYISKMSTKRQHWPHYFIGIIMTRYIVLARRVCTMMNSANPNPGHPLIYVPYVQQYDNIDFDNIYVIISCVAIVSVIGLVVCARGLAKMHWPWWIGWRGANVTRFQYDFRLSQWLPNFNSTNEYKPATRRQPHHPLPPSSACKRRRVFVTDSSFLLWNTHAHIMAAMWWQWRRASSKSSYSYIIRCRLYRSSRLTLLRRSLHNRIIRN